MLFTAIFGLISNLVMMKVLHSKPGGCGHDHSHGDGGHDHEHGHDHSNDHSHNDDTNQS